jgi:hypothetical protein
MGKARHWWHYDARHILVVEPTSHRSKHVMVARVHSWLAGIGIQKLPHSSRWFLLVMEHHVAPAWVWCLQSKVHFHVS